MAVAVIPYLLVSLFVVYIQCFICMTVQARVHFISMLLLQLLICSSSVNIVISCWSRSDVTAVDMICLCTVLLYYFIHGGLSVHSVVKCAIVMCEELLTIRDVCTPFIFTPWCSGSRVFCSSAFWAIANCYKLVKMLSVGVCVWMLTRVAQIVTATHRDL